MPLQTNNPDAKINADAKGARSVENIEKFEVGNVWIEVEKPDAFTAAPFVPFFQSFYQRVFGARPDLVEALQEITAKLETTKDKKKKAELEKKAEEITKLLDAENRKAFMLFFGELSEYERITFAKFLAKIIKAWSFDADITPDNVLRIPPLIFIDFFTWLYRVIMVGRADEINFSLVQLIESPEGKKKRG